MARPKAEKVKEERLSLRIGAEEKKNIKIFCIENGYKTITDFIMDCYEKEISKKNLKGVK